MTATRAAPSDVDVLPIEVDRLVKRYPKQRASAVDAISFQVHPGEIFGLLGPNGAGKTTTVGVLTTRVRPTGGSARVMGVDVAAHPVVARTRLAVVPQRSNLDRSLSVRQNLLFHAAYHGVPAAERARRADRLLDEFGLAERSGEKPDLFSGGQAQRMMIARALMHEPDVLFLDEPTTGLDPAARLFVWDRIRDLRERGVTVLLTTHYLDEAAELADRVGIMDHGRLLALDTPQRLTRTLPGSATLEVAVTVPPGLPAEVLVERLGALPGVERVERISDAGAVPGLDTPAVAARPARPARPGAGPAGAGPPGMAPAGGAAPAGSTVRVRLYLTGDAAALVSPAVAAAAALGGTLVDVRFGQPSLEDVFIHLTGRSLR